MLYVKLKFGLLILAALLNVFDLCFAASLLCYRKSITTYKKVPLTSPHKLLTDPNPCIDKRKDVIFMVPGFNNTLSDENVNTLLSTYISLGTVNVIYLDWSFESVGKTKNPAQAYLIAIANSKDIAYLLAKATIRLIKLGMSKNIHYVGHSLGANLVGEAGRQTIKQNFTIPWITALDPARLGFDPRVKYPPVDSTTANFVDVVHCDPGGYALNISTGHIDMYLNYGLYLNGTNMQPGCTKSFTPAEENADGNSCSHERCLYYLSVALKQPELFKVGQARNYSEWVQRNGNFNATTYLGPKVDKQQRGNYYCTTSNTKPWGKGDAGLVP